MTEPSPPSPSPDASTAASSSGWILRVDGPIVDVEFDPAALPAVGTALRMTPGAAPDDAPPWSLYAEVVAHEDRRVARAVALGDTLGLARGQPVFATRAPLEVPVGDATVGRILGPLGAALDGGAPLDGAPRRPLRPAAGAPLLVAPTATARRAPAALVPTGLRAVDLLAPLTRGGATAVLGGAGAGKTRLLLELCLRWQRAGAQQVVLASVGARADEPVQFALACARVQKASPTIVHAGMAEPAGLRAHAALAGLALAEAFRDAGRDVLLLVDDAWQAAQADAEIAIALRRAPPAAGGALCSAVRDALAAALRRDRGAGATAGVLSTIEAIHLPADDPSDPAVADLLTGLDARLVLSRTALARGVGPALEPLACDSVAMRPDVVGARHHRVASEVRAALHRAAELEDAVRVWGADGLDEDAQREYARGRRLARYLVQPLFAMEHVTGRPGAYSELAQTLEACEAILAGALDAVPERCFELAADLAEVRERARRAAT